MIPPPDCARRRRAAKRPMSVLCTSFRPPTTWRHPPLADGLLRSRLPVAAIAKWWGRGRQVVG